MKHCENCEHWIKVFVTYYGEYKDLSSKTKDDKTTEFGRCKKALFRNESSADEEIDIDDISRQAFPYLPHLSKDVKHSTVCTENLKTAIKIAFFVKIV